MVSWRNELLARLVAMEKEALDAWAVANMETDGFDAIPLGIWSQDNYPYIINRIGPSIPDGSQTSDQWGEGISMRTYTVDVRVVVDHFTSRYEGDNEELAHEIMPVLVLYFEKRLMLTTDSGTYATEPTWLSPEGIVIDTTGINTFETGGIGAIQIGEELSLQVPVIRSLNET
jgi:hypothetical protein